ncbi:MAG TPA: ATP cone domain-containing protein, partial [Gemmataceae bacterium]
MTDRAARVNWVLKRDGRLEPFDGGRISRALFAAGERTGRPDPLLARELTDGVIHFLAADATADLIAVDDLVEAVGKVVRELGHPALAQTFQSERAAAGPAAADSRPDSDVGLDAARPGAQRLVRRAAAATLARFARRALPPDLRA